MIAKGIDAAYRSLRLKGKYDRTMQILPRDEGWTLRWNSLIPADDLSGQETLEHKIRAEEFQRLLTGTIENLFPSALARRLEILQLYSPQGARLNKPLTLHVGTLLGKTERLRPSSIFKRLKMGLEAAHTVPLPPEGTWDYRISVCTPQGPGSWRGTAENDDDALDIAFGAVLCAQAILGHDPEPADIRTTEIQRSVCHPNINAAAHLRRARP